MMHALGGWKIRWRRSACAVAVIALSAAGCGGEAPKPAAIPPAAESATGTTGATSPAAKTTQKTAKGKESNMTAQEKRALRKKESGG